VRDSFSAPAPDRKRRAVEGVKLMEPKVDKKANSVDVLLDEAVFPRPVGLAAAYRFIDRCYVLVESRPGHRLSIRLKGKEPLAPAALTALAGEINNELLHQLVRRQVAERTDALRAAIVGRAVLSADAELAVEAPAAAAAAADPLDFQDDPLGIAVPWEEKYGGKRSEKRRAKSKR
jgi:His-Xaa-Ser system protein HxsD